MRVTVHIPDSLGPKLKEAAQSEGISPSALTARALEAYLKQRRKKNAGTRLLELIHPGSVSPKVWDELAKGSASLNRTGVD